jgi:hypothetical protein
MPANRREVMTNTRPLTGVALPEIQRDLIIRGMVAVPLELLTAPQRALLMKVMRIELDSRSGAVAVERGIAVPEALDLTSRA